MAIRTAKRLARDYSQVLTSVFCFMLSSGIPRTELKAMCARSLGRAENKAGLRSKDDPGGLVTAALVLDAWHRDRRYLTTGAVPKAVRLLGPAPSVEALVRAQRRQSNAAVIARRLRKLRLLVSAGQGLYRPTSDAAVISRYEPMVLQHAARALSTLLGTVTQNVTRSGHSLPLIERTAEVPDLPPEEVRAFQRFSKTQGRLLLRTINDWLESRRARKSVRRDSRSPVRAGVHVYAYVASRATR
jgi:hypothetical protein